MNDKPPLIIVGVSARAAAFSAYRAGYAPYWLDQFGDEDLREQFQGQATGAANYPEGIIELIRQAPAAAAFMFTGALENHLDVLEKLSGQRPLLGNSKQVCQKVRDPFELRKVFQRNDIPCPKIKTAPTGEVKDPTPGPGDTRPDINAAATGESTWSRPGTPASPDINVAATGESTWSHPRTPASPDINAAATGESIWSRPGAPASPDINAAATGESTWSRPGTPASPDINTAAADEAANRDWLVKPLRSAGGIGIAPYVNQPVDARHYLQEYIPGESFSAVFIGGQKRCRLLGVTRQLVGQPAFHAREFGYCGSIGPVELTASDKEQWTHIGKTIAAEFAVTGLFGVDAIKHKGSIYPIEVNPRYTASIEALELATGYQAIKIHCDACQSTEPQPARAANARQATKFPPGAYSRHSDEGRNPAEEEIVPSSATQHRHSGEGRHPVDKPSPHGQRNAVIPAKAGIRSTPPRGENNPPRELIGKAYLFAPVDLTFKELPATLHAEGETSFFATADIPAPGAEIKKGHPILTIIVSGDSLPSIDQTLKRTADSIFNHLS